MQNRSSSYFTDSSNTIYKFFQPDVEYVTKLNFYHTNPENSAIYNLKKTTGIENSTEQKKTILKFRTSLPKISSDSKNSSITQSYQYIHRLENQNFESNYEDKKVVLEQKIREYKLEKKKLFSQLSSIKKEIEDIHMDIDFLGNFSKNTYFQQKFSNLNNSNNLITPLRKRNSSENVNNYDKMMMMKKFIDKETDKKEVEILMKRKEIDKRKEIVEKIRSTIDKMTERNKKLNDELSSVKNNLLAHYHRLLTEGRDTRKEGLTWIIKSIWNLGEKVLASYLPSFLDETSISYLFDYAGREVEMNKIKKKLDDVRLFMKIKREKIKLNEKNLKNYKRENSLGATHYTFKTGLDSNDGGLLDDRSELGDFEITSDIIKYLIDKYRKENNLFDENLNLKKIQDMIQNRAELGDDKIEYIRSVQNLEAQLRSLENDMQVMRRKELDRINKEFYTNDYERRYKISLEGIISALIGEDNTPNEYAKQIRDQKIYYKKLEGLRSYNLLENTAKKSVLNHSIHFDSTIGLHQSFSRMTRDKLN